MRDTLQSDLQACILPSTLTHDSFFSPPLVAYFSRESKMVYTVELRFPLTSTISIDASASNSTSTLNPSSRAASFFFSSFILQQSRSIEQTEWRLHSSEIGSGRVRKEDVGSNKNSAEKSNKSEVVTEIPQIQESIEPKLEFFCRAKKRLKREALNNASSETKPENPSNTSNANTNRGQNQKKNNRKGKTNNSRMSDINSKPDFKISSTIWKEVGIQEGKDSTTESEVYQQLPESSILLLPIFESRLRNETSLKHLDWFERQKSKERFCNGNGDGRNKGKGKEQNSNNIPLGQRNTSQSSNSNVPSHQSSTSQPSIRPYQNSSTVPHYTGPPPSFNPTSSSIPHYNGPPPPFHSSLPAHPGFANGFNRNGHIASSQVRNVSMQPPVAQLDNQETSQVNPSSLKQNPLVSNSLLSKLSSMIPNASKSNSHSSMEPVPMKQDLNELTQFNQEVVEYATVELWSKERFEEMKSKAEIEVKELELSANQVDKRHIREIERRRKKWQKRSNEELEQNESSSQVKVEKKPRLESSSEENGDSKGKSEPAKKRQFQSRNLFRI
ncbi:hypothetical protein L7F22_030756 [Adiantum nelumboides]|nr:hypothetical protein [Adiantum nelumboides]